MKLKLRILRTDLKIISMLCLLLMAVGMMAIFISCEDENENNPSKLIVGMWQLYEWPGFGGGKNFPVYIIDFHADGTIIEVYNGSESKGTYTLDKDWSYDEDQRINGFINIIRPNETITYHYWVTEDKLVWCPKGREDGRGIISPYQYFIKYNIK